MGDAARIALWVNLYNATVTKEFSERPRKGSLLRHRGVFRKVGCEVGGDFFSLDVIEHGVLRLNSKPPYSLRRTLSQTTAASAPLRRGLTLESTSPSTAQLRPVRRSGPTPRTSSMSNSTQRPGRT